jgi:hypothetical protein
VAQPVRDDGLGSARGQKSHRPEDSNALAAFASVARWIVATVDG